MRFTRPGAVPTAYGGPPYRLSNSPLRSPGAPGAGPAAPAAPPPYRLSNPSLRSRGATVGAPAARVVTDDPEMGTGAVVGDHCPSISFDLARSPRVARVEPFSLVGRVALVTGAGAPDG